MGGTLDDFFQIILWAKIAFVLSILATIIWCLVQQFVKNEELRELNKKVLLAAITLAAVGMSFVFIVWASTGDLVK